MEREARRHWHIHTHTFVHGSYSSAFFFPFLFGAQRSSENITLTSFINSDDEFSWSYSE
jgi:hypothetical protein